MKSRFFSSLIISILIGIISLGSSHASHAPDATGQSTNSKKDGEIISILIAVNKNEIGAAKEALKKSSSPAVKKYAKMLKKEHTKNLNETLKLSKKIGVAPVECPTATEIKQNGANELTALSSLKGKDFDKAYIDAMVKGHTDVLQMMDDNLLKNVSNKSLKALLTATRPHIQSHLEQAKAIQSELNQSN